MINSLVYIPSGLQSPELEILLAKAQEIINSGSEQERFAKLDPFGAISF